MLLAYLKRIGIALSVLLNVILLGESNQTFSARNHGWKREGKPNATFMIDKLLGKQHCLLSWAYWAARKSKG